MAEAFSPLLEDKESSLAWSDDIDSEVPAEAKRRIHINGTALNFGKYGFDAEKAAKGLAPKVVGLIRPYVPESGISAIDGLEFVIASGVAWDSWKERDPGGLGTVKPIFATASAGVELFEFIEPFVPILNGVAPRVYQLGLVVKLGNAVVQGVVFNDDLGKPAAQVKA